MRGDSILFLIQARQKYKQTLRKPMETTPPYALSDLSPPCGSAPLLVAPLPYTLTGHPPSHDTVDTGRIKVCLCVCVCVGGVLITLCLRNN